MDKTFAALGAISGLLAVTLGALGAHALADRLTADRLALFETAARYQMYHALALWAAAWATTRYSTGSALWAGWLFAAGTVVFCGTVYALALGGPRWLGAVTPVGGLALMAGWAALLVAVARG
jgi:uncharacterized membrane protein YgdD (TMEM256/DUF423 family)